MSPARTNPSILLLPGWLGSGEGHWQTRWEQLHGHQRVEQDDWVWPRRGDWMARLEEVVLGVTVPGGPRCALVAHSLGCHLVAAWAAHSRHTARVDCALLVAPPDTDPALAPPNLHNWHPAPERNLPFRSHLLASSNDPFCAEPRAAALAAHWGSRYACLGPLGHLNAESGLGDWPLGQAILQDLVRDDPA